MRTATQTNNIVFGKYRVSISAMAWLTRLSLLRKSLVGHARNAFQVDNADAITICARELKLRVACTSICRDVDMAVEFEGEMEPARLAAYRNTEMDVTAGVVGAASSLIHLTQTSGHEGYQTGDQ